MRPRWSIRNAQNSAAGSSNAIVLIYDAGNRLIPSVRRSVPRAQSSVGFMSAIRPVHHLLTMRRDAEAKLVGVLYDRSPSSFAVISDSQDRHKIGTRVPRNGVYIDGSVGILRELDDDAEG